MVYLKKKTIEDRVLKQNVELELKKSNGTELRNVFPC